MTNQNHIMSREDNLNSDSMVCNRKAHIQLDFYHFEWQPNCEYSQGKKSEKDIAQIQLDFINKCESGFVSIQVLHHENGFWL